MCSLRSVPSPPIQWILAYGLAIAASQVSAAGFKVHDAQTRLVEDVYFLDADFDFRFSDEVRDALDNGVPITVNIDIQVRRTRDMLWDKRIAKIRARYVLEVHPLSNQYVLKNLNSGARRTFRTLNAAMNELASMRDFPLLDRHLLEPDQEYTLRLRARLDIEALPIPLRPKAYLSSLWRLNSDWYVWRMKP